MQALGNDFVVVDARRLAQSAPGSSLLVRWSEVAGALARALCDRHFGIGADGLILALDGQVLAQMRLGALASQEALLQSPGDIGWIYTNSDGSGSDMCGNGLRCLALLAVNRELVEKREFTVATGIGAIAVNCRSAESISIDIGAPKLRTDLIPLETKTQAQFVRQPLTLQAFGPRRELLVTCVGMGNPHCVVFGDYANTLHGSSELSALAGAIQNNDLFPAGVNVEFAAVKSPELVRVLVFERGCGPTLACASGAAACVVAGVLEKRLARSCTVELPGGSLQVSWSDSDGHVVLTGPAREVFDGQIDLLQFDSLRGLLAAEASCLQ